MSFYVGIIGGSSCSKETAKLAEETGKIIAQQKWIIVCGGMGGIMEAACKGAYENAGVTIGILPGNSRAEGNPYLTYCLPTGLGHIRNSLVVSSSNAIIAFRGSFGTLSEISFANINQIPVIGIGEFQHDVSIDNKPLFHKKTASPKEAVDILKQILK